MFFFLLGREYKCFIRLDMPYPFKVRNKLFECIAVALKSSENPHLKLDGLARITCKKRYFSLMLYLKTGLKHNERKENSTFHLTVRLVEHSMVSWKNLKNSAVTMILNRIYFEQKEKWRQIRYKMIPQPLNLDAVEKKDKTLLQMPLRIFGVN